MSFISSQCFLVRYQSSYYLALNFYLNLCRRLRKAKTLQNNLQEMHRYNQNSHQRLFCTLCKKDIIINVAVCKCARCLNYNNVVKHGIPEPTARHFYFQHTLFQNPPKVLIPVMLSLDNHIWITAVCDVEQSE